VAHSTADRPSLGLAPTRVSQAESARIAGVNPGRGLPQSALPRELAHRLALGLEGVILALLAAATAEDEDAGPPVTLPPEELYGAFKAKERDLLMVGARYCPRRAVLILYSAPGDRWEVPRAWILDPRASSRTGPDFSRLALTDYGQTVVLGEFELATDALDEKFLTPKR
jgi:hypothetical protein